MQVPVRADVRREDSDSEVTLRPTSKSHHQHGERAYEVVYVNAERR